MEVRYIHESNTGGVKQSANIMWKGEWRMRGGKFPSDHPCELNPAGLEAFKALYWANPFPEGDGITMDANGAPAEQVVRDIEACFGWDVFNYKPGYVPNNQFAVFNNI